MQHLGYLIYDAFRLYVFVRGVVEELAEFGRHPVVDSETGAARTGTMRNALNRRCDVTQCLVGRRHTA